MEHYIRHVFWPTEMRAALLSPRGIPIPISNAAWTSLGRSLSPIPPVMIMGFKDAKQARQAAWAAFQKLRAAVPRCDPAEEWGSEVVARAQDSTFRLVPVIDHIITVRKQDPEIHTLSNFWTEDVRLAALSKINSKATSPLVHWQSHTEEMLRSVAASPYAKDAGCIQFEDLAREMYHAGAGSCTTFRPVVAKAMFSGARRILDPCMGWGDRLLGALSMDDVEVYVGTDPNAKLTRRYASMARGLRPSCTVHALCQAFEDTPPMDVDPEHPANKYAPFDVVATSPPFFDREVYVEGDPQQSLERYPRMDAWIRGFLQPLLRMSLERLCVGGTVQLAIADYTDGRFTLDLIRYSERNAWCKAHCRFVGGRLFSMINADETLRGKPQTIFVWERTG